VRQHLPVRSVTIVAGLLILCLHPAFAQSPPPVSFNAAKNFRAGFTTSVAVSDFDGDGKRDLVVANNSGGVSVLLGNGDGTFQAGVNYTAGTTPYSVAVGDFNGDGHPDLVVANNGGGVSVLLGNGDGTFQPPVNYAAGTTPNSVAVGDFNGDGHPDLAVADQGGGVSVLLGNGDGTFQAGVNYTAGTTPYSVAVGDFNGDGHSDLAVANRGSGDVSVLLGNGDGTFQAAVNYTAGTTPNSVVVGDFNGDGRPDLVLVNYGGVSVLLGNGDGTFRTAVGYAANLRPDALAVGDFNGDGKADLAVGNSTSADVSVLLGHGDGTFQAAETYAAGSTPTSVAAGDFNGDGKTDLAVANTVNVSVLLGNGDGTFQGAVTYAAGATPYSVAVADFNGDGHPDLAVADQGGGVSVLLGNGDGTFQTAVNYTAGATPYSVAVGDFNSDGHPDLAVTNNGGGVSVLLGNGDGTFQPAANYAAGSAPSSVAVGDFNSDGKPDLAVTNQGSGNVSVLLGNGDGTFQVALNFAAGFVPNSVAVGDFNSDGKLDLAVLDANGEKLIVLLGNGDGTFQPSVNYYFSFPNSVAVGDFNGDGKPDLAVANNVSASVLLGNGDGTFQAQFDYAGGGFPNSVTVGDFNGDGKPDLAVADYVGGTVSILLNTTPEPTVQVTLGTSPAGLSFSVDGTTFSTAQTLTWTVGSSHTIATMSPQTSGGTQNTFASWSDGGAISHPVTAPLTATTYTASFTTSYQLTTAANPSNEGTVSPASGSYYTAGTVVSLLATPNSGYQFSGFSGDLTGTTNPQTLLMNGPKNVTANFASIQVATSTSVVSSANPVIFGQAVSLTATVTSSGSGTPTGTVTFFNGGTGLGTVALAGNQAAFSVSLMASTYQITAVYSGDTLFKSSTSATLYQSVITAPPGAVLYGVVTDRNTGQPLPGVSVSTGYASGAYSVCNAGTLTTTDASGGYSLTGLQLGNQGQGYVCFQLNGYYFNVAPYAITSGAVSVNVSLLAGGIVLQGTVTDASTQAAVGGASIYSQIWTADQATAELTNLNVTADNMGHYVVDSSLLPENTSQGFWMRGVSNGAPYTTVSAAGYLTLDAAAFTVLPPFPVVRNFSLVSSSSTAMQGTITDRNTGQPLSGVSVSTGYASGAYSVCNAGTLTTTDASGGYSLTGLQLGNQGQGYVCFQLNGYYFNVAPYAITSGAVSVNVSLLAGGIVLQGTVTDASTQAAVGGASIYSQIWTADQATAELTNLNVTADNMGHYVVDSSLLPENTSQGFWMRGVSNGAPYTTVSAAGYLTLDAAAFTVLPPFPVSRSFTLVSNGVDRTITIATSPAGSPIMVDGQNYTSPQTFTWHPSNPHAISTVAVISISTGSQESFTGWSDGGTLSHIIVVPDAVTTYTASFVTQYLLTATASPVAGGSVTAGGWFNSGASVSIQATANTGYQFTSFSGDLSGTTTPQTLVMNAPKNVTASFAPTLASTTTAASGSPNPSSYGQLITLTATVTTGYQTASGTVTFMDGASTLGTTALNGSGQATLTTSGLMAGPHNLVATYSGDGTHKTSSSSPVSQLVNNGTTATGLATSGPNPSVYGQQVTLSATVSAQFGGSLTGNVAFKDGVTTIGTAPLIGNIATFSSAAFVVGAHSITASYIGDANNVASTSGLVMQTVNRASTATSVTSSMNPQLVNQLITLTATVTGQLGGLATGSVVFKSGAATLGTGVLSGNQASLTTSFATAGTRSITAQYTGDTNNTGSVSAALSQSVVVKLTTKTTLSSSLNPSYIGQAVTLTASVTSLGGTPANGELITFKQGATVLGTAALSSSNASFTTSSLTVGTHTLTASYGGDATFNGSTSAGLAQVIKKYPTSTVLTSSLSPSIYGQSVTLSATVSSTGPSQATGTVTFKNGATTLATVALTSAVVTLTRANLPAGALSITATYNGDSSSAVSTSTVLTQAVYPATTTTTVVSSRNPSTLGQSVKFTATVASPTIIPTGTVTFSSGATVLATVTLAGGKSSFTTTTLPRGTNTITATYNGTVNIITSSGAVAQVVN